MALSLSDLLHEMFHRSLRDFINNAVAVNVEKAA